VVTSEIGVDGPRRGSAAVGSAALRVTSAGADRAGNQDDEEPT
jgi:hypothetical protein